MIEDREPDMNDVFVDAQSASYANWCAGSGNAGSITLRKAISGRRSKRRRSLRWGLGMGVQEHQRHCTGKPRRAVIRVGRSNVLNIVTV